MSSSSARSGFTLIEVLITAAIMAVVLSMVYGSYFAAARSSEVCRARMDMSRQARQTLSQMARQIRCAYAPQVLDEQEKNQAGMQRRNESPDKQISVVLDEDMARYFSGGSGRLNGEILNIVSAVSFTDSPDSAGGLFGVTYRFDRNTGLLLLSERRFVRESNVGLRDNVWQPILSGLERFEMTFFDGQKWFDEWDFKQRHEPPHAVKIAVTCEDESGRRCEYITTANIYCWQIRDSNT